MQKYIFIIYLAFIVLVSFITFILFGKDKKMAQKGGGPVRIKEKTLLGCCAYGGAIGGLIGRIVFHHKTNKGYFSFTIYVGLICQVAAAVALGYVAFAI